MIDRRDLLAGLGCVAALGAAEYLRPRNKLVLMPEGYSLKTIVPERFDRWVVGYGGDIVIPREEGSAADRIYNDRLARIYHDTSGALADVMILVAYGKTQNDALQVHRPEACYPANGYLISDRRFVAIDTRAGKPIPAVALTGINGSRVEDIVYWTRMGDALPRTAGEQRLTRYRESFAGYVGDGLLFRASAVRQDNTPLFGELQKFLGELIDATQPRLRAALIGRQYAA